ncbi:hypothetical protein [Thioclava nitratireducens]|uniref:hypothetical protein n=1 Tax=Thioclava nitratireducens TaxID=1915078 RepID=UPI0012FD1292|nr:hypothetical protein [Thioclava nitratireducens]
MEGSVSFVRGRRAASAAGNNAPGAATGFGPGVFDFPQGLLFAKIRKPGKGQALDSHGKFTEKGGPRAELRYLSADFLGYFPHIHSPGEVAERQCAIFRDKSVQHIENKQ